MTARTTTARNKHKKYGLRVGHSEGLVKHTTGLRFERQTDGIYIFCWVTSGGKKCIGWRAICGLRFAREQDALMAVRCLVQAGLDTFDKLRVADAGLVRRIATEHLQW